MGKVAQTTPIVRNGCQKCHIAAKNAANVAQTTPITEDGCQKCHMAAKNAANVAQTTHIRCTGRYSVRLHRGVPEAESPSTLAAGGPGLGSSVWRSAEHYEASWGHNAKYAPQDKPWCAVIPRRSTRPSSGHSGLNSGEPASGSSATKSCGICPKAPRGRGIGRLWDAVRSGPAQRLRPGESPIPSVRSTTHRSNLMRKAVQVDGHRAKAIR